jgi:hypothetical protein
MFPGVLHIVKSDLSGSWALVRRWRLTLGRIGTMQDQEMNVVNPGMHLHCTGSPRVDASIGAMLCEQLD